MGGTGRRPLLDRPAEAAINAARDRAGLLGKPRFPLPVRALTPQERDDALDQAAKNACTLCGGLHAAPNTPACPRIRTFRLDGDGRVAEGSFWQDGEFDASRILFVADVAEEPTSEEGKDS